MSNKEKRLEVLKGMLKIEHSMKISDISKRVGVSPMTTRRDIEILEAEGFVKVLHGAVIYNPLQDVGGLSDYMLTVAESQYKEEKKNIALKALSFIDDEDIIFLDAGSTTESLARRLPENINLTVICFSINIFLAVADHENIKTLLIGGNYNKETMILEDNSNCPILENNRTRKAFMSAGGVHSRLGVTCSNDNESATKKTALSRTAESYLLVDSSKFGLVNPCFIAETGDYNHIITDRNSISEEYIEYLDSINTEIHYV